MHKNKTFVRYDYREGDTVILNMNYCGGFCKCYWTKEKAPILKLKKHYTIVKIDHFGGGCPSKLLTLKGLEEHTGIFKGFPANWFKPFVKICG